MNSLSGLDILIFICYFVLVAGYGYWVYQKKKKASVDTIGLLKKLIISAANASGASSAISPIRSGADSSSLSYL